MPQISEPGTVGEDALAVRITTTTSTTPTTTTVWPPGEGELLFPVQTDNIGEDHEGVGCLVFNDFGRPSSAVGVHEGLDIGTDYRQEVYAVEDGDLYREFERGSSGLGWGLLSDTDVRYRYFHLDELAEGLEEEDRVSEGDVIGYVGDTGNASDGGWHLHFEVRPGPDYEPIDPMTVLAIPDPPCVVYPDRY